MTGVPQRGWFLAKLIITRDMCVSDPTRASMPFHVAKGVREAGYEVASELQQGAPPPKKQSW
jgi:hypothetical protein